MTTEGEPAQLNADAIVGEKIFHWMWRMKISQTDMARHLGISQTNVSRRLRGETGWTVADIMTAARVLKLPAGDLLPPPDDAGYAIRDSNPEPADFSTGADAPAELGKVLQLPTRPRSHTSTPTTGRGATVVRLVIPTRPRRTTTSSWTEQIDLDA